ncbi:hypothetical protein Pcinc_009635 [Petrolisthes cinctipes]|uniref:Uncharacterized protein n=1 Tax=Petrolisthes cinctipes TaxID=88211 RepID=A0AAE1G719_PETCI|nr:hypothetical protein Pcinc_009635 [Petrolisthes cinctipes]
MLRALWKKRPLRLPSSVYPPLFLYPLPSSPSAILNPSSSFEDFPHVPMGVERGVSDDPAHLPSDPVHRPCPDRSPALELGRARSDHWSEGVGLP